MSLGGNLFVKQSVQTRAIVPRQCSSLNLLLTKRLCSVPHHQLAVSSCCHGIEVLYKAIIAVTFGFVNQEDFAWAPPRATPVRPRKA